MSPSVLAPWQPGMEVFLAPVPPTEVVWNTNLWWVVLDPGILARLPIHVRARQLPPPLVADNPRRVYTGTTAETIPVSVAIESVEGSFFTLVGGAYTVTNVMTHAVMAAGPLDPLPGNTLTYQAAGLPVGIYDVSFTATIAEGHQVDHRPVRLTIRPAIMVPAAPAVRLRQLPPPLLKNSTRRDHVMTVGGSTPVSVAIEGKSFLELESPTYSVRDAIRNVVVTTGSLAIGDGNTLTYTAMGLQVGVYDITFRVVANGVPANSPPVRLSVRPATPSY